MKICKFLLAKLLLGLYNSIHNNGFSTPYKKRTNLSNSHALSCFRILEINVHLHWVSCLENWTSSNNRRSFVKSSPQIYHTAAVTTEALSPKGTSFPVSCSMPTQQNLLKSHKLNNNHEKASTADMFSLKKLPTQHLTIISRTWNIRFSANQFYNLSLQFRGLNWLWGTEMKPALIGLVVMNKHRPVLFLFWLFCMASSRYSLF